jgi:parvulin-like peptidyl-prolyl isomerase
MPEVEKQPVVEKEAAKKINVTKKVFLFGFFGFLGLILIASVGTGIYRVYAKSASDKFSVAVATVLRLPVAKVNGQTILFSDYFDDLSAIKAMRSFDAKSNGPAASLTDENLSDQVLFRQVNNVLIKEMAAKFGVKVEQADIDSVKKDILIQQFGDLTKAEAAIKERYGWTLAQFEKKVIGQYILQNKLAKIIASDTVAREKIRVEAQGVLDQIKGGADFVAMAAKYGSDGTAQKGGDLGWFAKGDMVPEFETAAFALKKGELSPVLVETQYGYHVVQTMDKKTEKVKDESGKNVNKEQVIARHILFAFPSLDKILSDAIKKATIHVYGKINNPFKVLTETPASETN